MENNEIIQKLTPHNRENGTFMTRVYYASMDYHKAEIARE